MHHEALVERKARARRRRQEAATVLAGRFGVTPPNYGQVNRRDPLVAELREHEIEADFLDSLVASSSEVGAEATGAAEPLTAAPGRAVRAYTRRGGGPGASPGAMLEADG